MRMRVKISKGNIKLGKISNISLSPVFSCPTAPCNQYCYAVKTTRLRSAARRAWKTNLSFYKEHPEDFFFEIRCWLVVNETKEFRWHVGGDIPNYHYFCRMAEIARQFPDIRFMVFTKRYGYIKEYGHIPKNLAVIFSAWPGWKIPRTTRPIAFIKGDPRAKNYIVCEGRCDLCYQCFDLPELKKNVLLKPLAHYKP